MKEMNLIGLKQADYPATGSSGICSTLATCLQSSCDIVPIVDVPPACSTLNITRAIAEEKGESLAEYLVALENGRGEKMVKVIGLCGSFQFSDFEKKGNHFI